MSAGTAMVEKWPDVKMVQYPSPRREVTWPASPIPLSLSWMEEVDIAERLRYALALLTAVVHIEPEVRGGVPVLAGTRVPISRLFAEIADGQSIGEVADDKELDVEAIRSLFRGFAVYFGRPFYK